MAGIPAAGQYPFCGMGGGSGIVGRSIGGGAGTGILHTGGGIGIGYEKKGGRTAGALGICSGAGLETAGGIRTAGGKPQLMGGLTGGAADMFGGFGMVNCGGLFGKLYEDWKNPAKGTGGPSTPGAMTGCRGGLICRGGVGAKLLHRQHHVRKRQDTRAQK